MITVRYDAFSQSDCEESCRLLTVNFLSLWILDPLADSLPLPFATGLFSFLYHLAYYEIGKYNQNSVLEYRNTLTVTIKHHGYKTENLHVRLPLACGKVLLKIWYWVFIAGQLCIITTLFLRKSDCELLTILSWSITISLSRSSSLCFSLFRCWSPGLLWLIRSSSQSSGTSGRR